MSQQHRRVYGIMARSLDNVATDLGQFATGIDTAAKSVTNTDDDIGGELLLRALTLQANNTDLNDYDPHLVTGASTTGVSPMTGNQEQRLRHLIAGAQLDAAIDAELDQWKNARDRLHDVGAALIAVSTPVSENLGKETVAERPRGVQGGRREGQRARRRHPGDPPGAAARGDRSPARPRRRSPRWTATSATSRSSSR